jgi:tetratricopeptide (TPR) repeat protein
MGAPVPAPADEFPGESGAFSPLGEKSRSDPILRRAGKAAAFCLFFCLALSLSGTLGCARQEADENSDPAERELLRQMDPSAWNLSREAEHLYYYLLLSQGLADDSRPAVSYSLQGLLRLDPSLPVYRDAATILLSRGEFDAAESIAGKGLGQYPDDPVLTLLLAGTCSENRQTPKAVAILEDYLKQHPDAAEVSEELVRLYLKEGRNDKASDLLARLPQDNLSAEAELFRAGALSTVGRTGEARELLQRLLEKHPSFFEAWLELAYIAEREKNLAEAVTAYGKALELAPENPEIWLKIASLHIAGGNPAEAVRVLENAPPRASLFMRGAVRFADAGHFREAESLVEKARENGGDADELALLLSMIREKNSADPWDGLAPLEQINPDGPLYPAALEQKAHLLMQAGEFEQARAVAAKGRERFPERKDLWLLEASALIKMKKTGEARDLITQSIAQEPGNEDLLFFLGGIQDETGEKGEAMKTMELILSINPQNYQALNYVGYTLADDNRELDRALALITRALEQKPDADYIVDSLAWAQFRLGRFDEAWTNINRCLGLGGDGPVIWEHYGDIALALGKREEAAKGYAEAISRMPDNIDALRAKLTELKK